MLRERTYRSAVLSKDNAHGRVFGRLGFLPSPRKLLLSALHLLPLSLSLYCLLGSVCTLL